MRRRRLDLGMASCFQSLLIFTSQVTTACLPDQPLKHSDRPDQPLNDIDSEPLTFSQRLDNIGGMIRTLESHLAELKAPGIYNAEVQNLFGDLHKAVSKVPWKDIPSAASTATRDVTQDASSGSLKLGAAQEGEVETEPKLVYRRANTWAKGWASKEKNHGQDLLEKLLNLLEKEAYKQLKTGMYDMQTIQESYLGLVRLIDKKHLKCDVDSCEELLCFDS